MPQIIVTADTSGDLQTHPVMFAERVSVSDFESQHFQSQLVERLGWAVGDAHAVEQDGVEVDPEEGPADARREPDELAGDGASIEEFGRRANAAQPVS